MDCLAGALGCLHQHEKHTHDPNIKSDPHYLVIFVCEQTQISCQTVWPHGGWCVGWCIIFELLSNLKDVSFVKGDIFARTPLSCIHWRSNQSSSHSQDWDRHTERRLFCVAVGLTPWFFLKWQHTGSWSNAQYVWVGVCMCLCAAAARMWSDTSTAFEEPWNLLFLGPNLWCHSTQNNMFWFCAFSICVVYKTVRPSALAEGPFVRCHVMFCTIHSNRGGTEDRDLRSSAFWAYRFKTGSSISNVKVRKCFQRQIVDFLLDLGQGCQRMICRSQWDKNFGFEVSTAFLVAAFLCCCHHTNGGQNSSNSPKLWLQHLREPTYPYQLSCQASKAFYTLSHFFFFFFLKDTKVGSKGADMALLASSLSWTTFPFSVFPLLCNVPSV